MKCDFQGFPERFGASWEKAKKWEHTVICLMGVALIAEFLTLVWAFVFRLALA